MSKLTAATQSTAQAQVPQALPVERMAMFCTAELLAAFTVPLSHWFAEAGATTVVRATPAPLRKTYGLQTTTSLYVPGPICTMYCFLMLESVMLFIAAVIVLKVLPPG